MSSNGTGIPTGMPPAGLQAVPQPLAPPAMAVEPQPLPTAINVIGVRLAGRPFVRLEAHTPAGIAVVMLPPETAKQVASHLAQAAQQITTGLILPGPG